MLERLVAVVPADSPSTVAGVLRSQLGASGHFIRQLIRIGELRLNGEPCRLRDAVRPGDELVATWLEPDSARVDPEPVALSILHEDDDLIALDKPSGMVVHPTHGCHHGTLANGVAQHLLNQGRPAGIHPLHRLDRQTSGVILFAKHGYAHQQLASQLAEFKLERRYVAIATGRVPSDSGTIEAGIVRLGGPGGRRGVSDEGQSATTHYQVLARRDDETLLSLSLETGRTHQIRVHLAHLGHPLAGDPLYGQPHPGLGRLALHACSLKVRHPRTRAELLLEAPWPEELAGYLAGWGLEEALWAPGRPGPS